MTAERSPERVVRIEPAGVELPVHPGETIVDAVRRNGYRTRYCCRRGGCGACKADLVSGVVDYRTPIAATVLSATELAEGKCIPCRAIPRGEVVIRLSDRDTLRRIFHHANTPSNAGTQKENLS
jgi:CDP-4-dehydro-6-deoxyglucose reductase